MAISEYRKRQLGSGLQRQAVPAASGRAGNVPYYSARYVGGPLMRLLELPQQYVYAASVSLQGRSLDDWDVVAPMHRILFPGRAGRITEEMVSGTDNMFANLAIAVALDPLNFVGVGAVTKLGKSKGLLRGILSREELGPRLAKLMTEETPGFYASKYRKQLAAAPPPGMLQEAGMLREAKGMLRETGRRAADLDEFRATTNHRGLLAEMESPDVYLSQRYPGHRRGFLDELPGGQYLDEIRGGPLGEARAPLLAEEISGVPALRGEMGLERIAQPVPKTLRESEFQSFFAEIDPRNFGNPYRQPRDITNWLRSSENRQILEAKLDLLGLSPDDMEGIRPVLEAFDIKGGEALDTFTRFSSRLRADEVHLFGVGGKTGWGGLSEMDLLERFRAPAADVVGMIERGWHEGVEQFIKRGRLKYSVPMVRKAGHVLTVMNPDDASEIVKLTHMGNAAQEVEFYGKSLTGEGGVVELAKAMENAEINSDLFMYRFENAQSTTEDVIKYADDPVYGPVINGFRSFLFKHGMMQQDARMFPMLGAGYLARVANKLDTGESVMNKVARDMIGLSEGAMKELGIGGNEIAALGDDIMMEVSTSHQLARSESMPEYIKKIWTAANRKASEIEELAAKTSILGLKAKRLAKVKELRDATLRFKKINEVYNISRELGPQAVNREIRKIFEPEILEFLETKDAKKLGWKTIEDFQQYSENPIDILRTYSKATAKAKATQNTVVDFAHQHLVKTSIRKGDKLVESAEALALKNISRSISKERRVEDAMTGLRDRLGKPSWDNLDRMFGKLLEGHSGDPGSLDVLAEVVNGWTRVQVEHPFWGKTYDPIQNWWARATLFGGRASYLFNNLVGDTWNAMLAGVSHKYLVGAPGLQALLPEGKTFAQGLSSVVGAADDVLLIPGQTHTARQLREWYTGFGLEGGQTTSDIFMANEALRKRTAYIDKKLSGLGYLFNWESAKMGDIVPVTRQIAAFSEGYRRMNTFMHFLEQGLAPIDAARQVWKYHFNYNQQNKIARRIAPFYFWTSSNVPLQMKNFFKQPAKQMIPFKAQKVFDPAGFIDSPTEDARPEYLKASGIFMRHHKGKDYYLDIANLPGPAALRLTGLLSTPGQIYDDMARDFASMASPMIQIPVEWIMNKDVFTGRAITGGGTGIIPERGIREIGIPGLGKLNIEGMPWPQRIVHGLQSGFTPLQLIESTGRFAEDAPWQEALAKVAIGAPIRKVNRLSTEWINLARERNELRTYLNHYIAVGKRKKEVEMRIEIRGLNRRLSRLSRRLKVEEAREGLLKRKKVGAK